MTILNETLGSQPASGMGQFLFGGLDYFVFLLMLTVSSAIGVYFGFLAKRENTTDEYLMGGRKMKTIPIGISLVASQLSAFAIMTLPGELYAYGVNHIFNVIAMVINVPILIWIVIPVFYNNNISNCYEYLERRFNRATRRLLETSFVLTVIVMLPIFNFMPSLAFAQVTNFNIHIINLIISSICVFYTMFGGIKAVVWTDVVQLGIMVFSVVFVCVMGICKVGGLSAVLELAQAGKRLEPNFTFDLKSRMTFWNATLNSICLWVSYVGLNQSCVQRIVSLPTLQHAKRSLIFFGCLLVLINGFNCFTGIVIYAYYHACDPIAAGLVEKPDKLLPFFVQDIAGHLTGIPGLFICCVFSASLSTMSASMNTLAGVLYLDCIRPRIQHSESRANFIMKIVVLCFGVYCISAGFVVEKFSSIFQIIYTIIGVSFGTIFGVFLMGMLVPRVHGRAALWAVVTSMIVMAAIALRAQGRSQYKFLPSSTDSCAVANGTLAVSKNSTLNGNIEAPSATEAGWDFFEISFNWFTVVGGLIVFVVGVPLSYLLPAGKHEKLDPNLLSPIIRPYVKYQQTKSDEPAVLNEKLCKDTLDSPPLL